MLLRIMALWLMLAGLCLATEVDWTITFLQQLMQNPGKIVSQEEALKQIDEIKAARDVGPLVPVAFGAAHSKSTQAQLYGASALYGIAIRADGRAILQRNGEEIMRLLAHENLRMKMAAVALAETAVLPPEMYEQRYMDFLANAAEPAEVKPAMVGALVRGPNHKEAKIRRITEYLGREEGLARRVDSYNAMGAHPTDQAWQADLIAIGLSDREEEIRKLAITLLQRLGPQTTLRQREKLLRLANDMTETPAVRQMAQRAIGN